MCTAVLVGDYDVVDFFNLDVLLVFYYDRRISIRKNTVYLSLYFLFICIPILEMLDVD